MADQGHRPPDAPVDGGVDPDAGRSSVPACPRVALTSLFRHARYNFIQKELRAKGLWTYSDSRLKVVNNFGRDFGLLLKHAAIKTGEFHDLRRTAICNWFAQGLSEYEIMKLAGHADFKTTHKFYLRVRDDLVHRARQASSRALSRNLARTWHAPLFSPAQQKRPTTVSDCQPYVLQQWAGLELNQRHTDFQSVALPTELPARVMSY